MKEIRDRYGHLACKGDPSTGAIEIVYKSQTIQIYLPVSGRVSIERDRTRVEIFRVSASEFAAGSPALF